jgi:hypothetical protein
MADCPGTGRVAAREGRRIVVAKRTDKKRSRKAGAAVPVGERIERLEKALAAGLRREAKAASRLETAQLEVAVLRMALAELVAEANGAPPAVVVAEVTESQAQPVTSTAPEPVARPRAPRARTVVAAKLAPAKPAPTKPAAPAKPATLRRSTRPGPGAGAPDR